MTKCIGMHLYHLYLYTEKYHCDRIKYHPKIMKFHHETMKCHQNLRLTTKNSYGFQFECVERTLKYS